MASLLYLKSSINGERSRSDRLCREFIQARRWEDPSLQVITRDLVADPLPHLDGAALSALTSAELPGDEQARQLRQRADALLEEFACADQVLIALPLYNFGIPTQLKSYFDHLARAGFSFRFSEQGPVGLLQDREVVLVSTRGSILPEQEDHQLPAVKQFLALLGISQVRHLIADGLDLSKKQGESSLQRASERLDALTLTAIPA